ncbi:retrovirus-related pol polyprotein from transposon TNT 1-94, partial [Tanacetum coccineum]
MLLNSVGQKGSRGNIVMPELHNKMELLKERTRPLLRLLGPCLQIHFYLTLFGLKQLVLLTGKTPYELLTGKIPIISYIRPFGCHVTILNTIDHLGKFAGKSDEGFLVGYSLQSKAFRVYNLETKRVEENLHITFLENKPNVAGKGPTWLFDLDYLTDSMNYHPVRSENQANLHAGQQEANQNAGTEDIIDAGDSEKEDESAQDCFMKNRRRSPPREEEQVFLDELERLKRQEKEANKEAEALRKEFAQETENLVIQEGAAKTSMADFTNLETVVNVSPIPTSRIISSHPSALILGKSQSRFVNFLSETHFLGNANSKPILATSKLQRPNILLVASCDGKFCGFKITFSTDSAKLVPLGKVCTAIETLEKNTAKALISLLTTITLSTTMAILDSCPKHNMVAYLEKSEGNAEFHEIIDFLKRSYIHHAFTGKFTPYLPSMFGNNQLRMKGAPSERPSEAQPTPLLATLVKYLLRAHRSEKRLDTINKKDGGDRNCMYELKWDEFAKENAQERGGQENIVGEEEGRIDEIILSMKTLLSKLIRRKQIEGTDEQIESTDEQRKGSSNMSQAKAVSREKEKAEVSYQSNGKTKSPWKLKVQDDKAEHLEEINQNVVIRSNGQKRYFSTLMRVLSIFDREDLNAVYQLGDLMVMFNPDDEDEFWNSHQDWNIVSWKLHGSSGVHTLVTEAGLVIHMLVEKKYPLRKKVLLKMLELKLESEEDNTMALELIRFVKKLLAELEPE